MDKKKKADLAQQHQRERQAREQQERQAREQRERQQREEREREERLRQEREAAAVSGSGTEIEMTRQVSLCYKHTCTKHAHQDRPIAADMGRAGSDTVLQWGLIYHCEW